MDHLVGSIFIATTCSVSRRKVLARPSKSLGRRNRSSYFVVYHFHMLRLNPRIRKNPPAGRACALTDEPGGVSHRPMGAEIRPRASLGRPTEAEGGPDVRRRGPAGIKGLTFGEQAHCRFATRTRWPPGHPRKSSHRLGPRTRPTLTRHPCCLPRCRAHASGAGRSTPWVCLWRRLVGRHPQDICTHR